MTSPEKAAGGLTATELAESFRRAGKRLTPQRTVIAEAVAGAGSHPTAEAVFETASKQLPSLSLKTVYQTLNELVALGSLTQIDLGTGSARFDMRTDNHHHTVCEVCGIINDVVLDTNALSLPGEVRTQFQPTHTEVVVRGRCAHHDSVEMESTGP